jgi:hypothetical protein
MFAWIIPTMLRAPRAAAYLCAPSGIAHFSAVAADLGGDDAGLSMPADGYRSAGLSEVA